MAQTKIPIRPQGRFKLRAEECDCLTWYILKGCTQIEAYGLFVRPDLAFQKTLLRREAQQFFASPDAVAYLKAYQRIVDGEETASVESTEISSKDLEKKKLEAVQALIKWATEQSIAIDSLDDDTATLVLKVADKVGLFSDLERAEEKPRRYLPVRCQSECQYRLFCESQGENIINECDYCRTRKFAEENGYHYDVTKNLDIPTEILAENNLENYKIIDDAEN